MIIDKISFSRLGIFEQCQYRYKLHYHDKVKSPLPEPPYFEYGHYIHKIAELVVSENIPVEIASKKSFEKYNKFGKEYINKIPIMIRNFINFQEHIKSSSPLHDSAELEFNIEKDGFILNGFIDRVIKYNNDKTLIADYKTSKSHNETLQKDIHESKQLKMYVWAYSQTKNVPVEKISAMLFYLESGNKPITRFTTTEIENHIEKTITFSKCIRNMEPEDAKPNITNLCKWCEYRTICKPYLQSK